MICSLITKIWKECMLYVFYYSMVTTLFPLSFHTKTTLSLEKNQDRIRQSKVSMTYRMEQCIQAYAHTKPDHMHDISHIQLFASEQQKALQEIFKPVHRCLHCEGPSSYLTWLASPLVHKMLSAKASQLYWSLSPFAFHISQNTGGPQALELLPPSIRAIHCVPSFKKAL